MERARTSCDYDHRVSTISKNIPANSGESIGKKWRFRPRSIWPFAMWGLVVFAGLKITIIPLAEGVYYYIASATEIHQLKNQYASMQKQLADLRKKCDYMKTPSYVEERAHEIGLVKSDESQMVVSDGAPEDGSPGKKSDFRKKTDGKN